MGATRVVGTACLPAAGAMARDTTIRADSSGGRGCSDPSDHCPGSEVRAIWLPEDHSVAAECGLGSGQGPGAADLAAGGAESAAKTKAARTAVAERRFLCTTEAGATEPALLRNSRSRRTGPRSSSASVHALRSWHSKLRHPVKHSALDRGFDFLVLDRAGREAYSEYRLVP